MENKKNCNFIQNCSLPIAYQEIISDKEGFPVEYKIIEKNEAFEEISRLNNRKELIEVYGDVALKGDEKCIELYDKEQKTHYSVTIYSPCKKFFVTIFNDITKYKKTEEKLKESEERLELAIDAADIGLWEWRIDTGETVFNEKWAQLHGFTQNELSEKGIKTWVELVHPKDLKKANKLLKKHFDAKIGCFESEMRMKQKNKEWVWMLCRGKVFDWDVNGNPKRMAGTHLDISKIKHYEKYLKDLNATKDKFFSIVAHDLKNPFNAIIGFTDLISEKSIENDDEEIKEYSSIIMEAANQTLDLLNNLLQWSRAQTNRIEFNPNTINLKRQVDKMENLHKANLEKKQIDFVKTDLDLNFEADEFMISTILRNLISNAIKYTPEGGKIKVFAKQLSNAIEIHVKDTGVGISPKDVKRLFRIDKSFSAEGTNKEQGTGLGLLLCKEFVGKHGGEIWVKSKENKGSEFIFTISTS